MDNMVNAGSGAGLSNTLQSQFEKWRQAREPLELKLLENYQDMMRIPRQTDTKTTGISRAQKSEIFIGSTRGKIRSARAKINDVLFGSGKMPFDTSPTKEELREFADAVEEILVYQMQEGGFKKSIKTGVDSICTYGTGYIFGPFVKDEEYKDVTQVQGPLGPQLQENVIKYPCPYYEHGRTLDIYVDPDAENEKDGMGVYWSVRKEADFFRSLKGQSGYSDAQIDAAIQMGKSQEQMQGSEYAEQIRNNIYRYEKDGRIWFQRFFGKVKRSKLDEWRKEYLNESSDEEPQSLDDMAPESDQEENEELVEAIIQMAGGYVIKAEENPYKSKRRPVARCVYEDVEHEVNGVGIADNNEPHQRVTNASFRLYLEGKSYALLKTGSVDRSKYSAKEDFKRFPGKLYDMKPGLTPDERKTAMIMNDIVDVTDGWERVIEMSENFSDNDTGITKYSQGTDSSNLNKTAAGISMIMNASSLPMKEVISHVDEMWIEEMIEALIDWDLEFLEPEIVAKTVGEKQAQAWAQVKQLGKTSFMKWNATGSQTFMQKEVLMNKLQGFMQVALGNPITAPLVDARELLEQVWDAGEVGKESPVYTDEDMKQKQSAPPPPGPIDIEKVKGEIAAEAKHQDAEIKIILQQMADRQKELDRKQNDENAELAAQVQILLKRMDQIGAQTLQSDQIQADTVHKMVDVLGQPDPMEMSEGMQDE